MLSQSTYYYEDRPTLFLPMRVDDGAAEDSGDAPVSSWLPAVVILRGTDCVLLLDSLPRRPGVM